MPLRDVIRVVLDTNVIVSGAINPHGAPFSILEAWRQGRLQLIMSSAQRAEIETTLNRPRFSLRFGLAEDEIAALLNEIDLRAEFVWAPSETNVIVRDPDDRPILAAALAGNANFLVSGDKDLLVLADRAEVSAVRIISPAMFATFLST